MNKHGKFGPGEHGQFGPGEFGPGPGQFQEPFQGPFYNGGHDMLCASHGLVAWLLLLLFAVLVVAVIFALIKLAKRRPASGVAPVAAFAPTDPALQELRLRYARGDIAREDYLQRGADLGDPNPAARATPPASPPAT
ncbi:MAG: hypothetical protein ACR2FO_00060 [Actinomycetota bacterium]